MQQFGAGMPDYEIDVSFVGSAAASQSLTAGKLTLLMYGSWPRWPTFQ